MKKTILNSLTICTLFFATALNAQVGIGVPAENIHPSAELEVKSTTKGFLPPRMTKAERDAIVTPAAGLLIYQTDGDANNYRNVGQYTSGGTTNTSLISGPGLYYFDGKDWKNVVGAQGDTGAQGIQGETGAVGLKGDTGAQGIQGEVGLQGVTGEQGTKGDKGDKGEQGLPGNNGVSGYPFNPIQFAEGMPKFGETRSYYYTILLSQATTISGFQIEMYKDYYSSNICSDPMRCGIYRGRLASRAPGSITLVGQTSSIIPSGSDHLREPIIALPGQNLSFAAGEYITIAFHTAGSTNRFYASGGESWYDLSFSGAANYASSGFPATLTQTEIAGKCPGKICFELY